MITESRIVEVKMKLLPELQNLYFHIHPQKIQGSDWLKLPQSLQDRCWCRTYSEHLRNIGDKINDGGCADGIVYWSKPA